MLNNNYFILLVCGSFILMASCGSNSKTHTKLDKAEVAVKDVQDSKDIESKKDRSPGVFKNTEENMAYAAIDRVALFEGGEVGAQEFNDEVKKIAPMLRDVPPAKLKIIKTRVIDGLVAKRIVEILVEPTIKNVKEEDMAIEFQRFRDQVSQSHGGVEAFYEREKLTERDIKEDMRKGLALKALLAKDYDIIASPKEIEAFYIKNKARYDKQDEVKASHILFKASSDDEAQLSEAKKKATEVYKFALKRGADFGELAKKYSEGPSGPNGGDLGFFAKDWMVTEFGEAAFSTKKGGITEPVKTSFGYHIIKVFDKKKGGLIPLSEVSDHIAHLVEMKKMKEATSMLLRQERERRKVELLHENVIDNPDFSTPATEAESQKQRHR